MFTVYVLQDRDGKVYKGMTEDMDRRLKQHASGHTRTTRGMIDLRVVYSEEFQTSLEARAREKYLKSAAGRRFLKEQLCVHSSAG